MGDVKMEKCVSKLRERGLQGRKGFGVNKRRSEIGDGLALCCRDRKKETSLRVSDQKGVK
jgi:hypothetical protein